MARRKLTQQQERSLVDAYRSWEPGGTVSAEELAQQHGVSRQVMYAVLARHGVSLKSRLTNSDAETVDSVLDAMADAALDKLFARLSEAERRVEALERGIDAYLAGGSKAELRVVRSALSED